MALFIVTALGGGENKESKLKDKKLMGGFKKEKISNWVHHHK